MSKPTGPKGLTLEWSHGKRRPSARTAGGDVPALPPIPAEDSAPTNDPTTGRFQKGNRAYRRRQLKERARGIATLNPKACPSWLSPFVAEGARLAAELSQRFPDDAALRPLIGAAVDAWVLYRALLALGAQGDGEALKESRAWMREHRSLLATISGMAGELPDGAAGTRTVDDLRSRVLGRSKP
jgi:hypothetical protein